MLSVLLTVACLVFLGALFFAVARASARTARIVWLTVFAVVLGSAVTMMGAHAFLSKWSFRGDSTRYGLLQLIDGTAERPFVFRRLAPDIVGYAADMAQEHLSRATLDGLINTSRLVHYRGFTGIDVESWSERKAVAVHVAFILFWSCLFGTYFVGIALLLTVGKCSTLEAIVTSAIGLALVPLMFVEGGYLYDASELLLLSTVILLAFRGYYLLLPPLVLLMAINKESALLAVPPLFPIIARRSGWKIAGVVTGLLTLVGLAWFLYIRARYAASPGMDRETWIAYNFAFWTNLKNYFRFNGLYSPVLPAPRGANVIILLLLSFPLLKGWAVSRSDVRLATIISAAIAVPLFLTSCYGDEIRNLSMIFPYLFLICTSGVREMMKPDNGETCTRQDVMLPTPQPRVSK